MLQPMGPLAPAVYWRRRALALGGIVIALVVLIWSISTAVGGEQPDRDAASPTTTTTAPSSPTSTTATTTTGTTTTTTETETSTATSTTISTTTPGPPKPCPDDVIEVAANAAQPRYQVGQQPDLRLVITNAGDVPCVRNLDRSLLELLIYGDGGDTRLWGSNDCYPNPSNDKRTLEPGEQAVFPVTWSGKSSQPRCAGQRVTVPAGEYQLIGRFGDLESEPTAITLVR